MKSSTSAFTDITLLYDDGNFAIAKGLWVNPDKTREECMGVRWHNETSEGGDSIGYPQTYGKPQWLVLPTNIGKMIEGLLSLLDMHKNLVK